jgi:hypothetical protein
MTTNNRVLHQEYLQMWLNGEELQISEHYTDNRYYDFNLKDFSMLCFNDETYTFRKKPKLVKVDIEKFKDCALDCNFKCYSYGGILEMLSECIVED